MLDLKRQYATIKDDVDAAVERVMTSQHFIGGPELDGFERESAEYLGAKASIGCASGTDALWLALRGCGVEENTSVVTTPFSFFASVSSIVRCGATPVLADVDPATLNLDPNRVEAALKRGTRDRTFVPSCRCTCTDNAPTWIASTAMSPANMASRSSRTRRRLSERQLEGQEGRHAGKGCGIQLLSDKEPERLWRRRLRHYRRSRCRRPCASSAQSRQRPSLLSRRDRLEQPAGRHAGGRATREAEAHRRLEPEAAHDCLPLSRPVCRGGTGAKLKATTVSKQSPIAFLKTSAGSTPHLSPVRRPCLAAGMNCETF